MITWALVHKDINLEDREYVLDGDAFYFSSNIDYLLKMQKNNGGILTQVELSDNSILEHLNEFGSEPKIRIRFLKILKDLT